MFASLRPLNLKRQYAVKYRKAGLWFTAYFSKPGMALAFSRVIRHNPAVDRVTKPRELNQ